MRECVAILFLLSFLMTACREGGSSSDGKLPETSVLVTAGDSALTVEEVVHRIPSGLTEEDSVALFSRIVENWVEQRVLIALAEENVIDLDRIDRLTQEYRNQLIIEEYLRKKTLSGQTEIRPEAIRSYYESHKEDFRLREPILKGIYIQASETDPQLPEIREWMASGKEDALDRLEKHGMQRPIRYEYFVDRWVGWNAVMEKIPSRIEDGDEFLAGNKDFETVNRGTVYRLHVMDWIPSGEIAPLEYVSPRIAGLLAETASSKARAQLIRSIYVNSIKNGRLVPGLYNPLTGRIGAPEGSRSGKQ